MRGVRRGMVRSRRDSPRPSGRPHAQEPTYEPSANRWELQAGLAGEASLVARGLLLASMGTMASAPRRGVGAATGTRSCPASSGPLIHALGKWTREADGHTSKR